jgi:hypothetical protein
VKFLIDNDISPLLADALKAAGHDAGAMVVIHEDTLRVRRLPI